MTQAQVKFANFEAYLVWSDDPENYREGFFELIDGQLVELAPVSGLSATIANRIFFLLVAAGLVPLELVRPGKCEVQVPVLRPQDSANRYPDLVILQPEHVALTQSQPFCHRTVYLSISRLAIGQFCYPTCQTKSNDSGQS
jgi:Uma2 family endonuclease